MNTLILGASGLVGGNCLEVFRAAGWNCLGTHFSFATQESVFYNTLNPADPNNTDVDSFNPQVIIHCGALTHVDYCEDHVQESFEKTVKSTQHAIALAKRFDATLVYLSTDYVFDGHHGFYKEEDECRPLGIYAKHKLEAEMLVRHSGISYLVCRVTNVYGNEIRGKNFIARLAENMKKGEPMELRLPYDQYATPVNAHDVARAIHTLLSNHKTGVYHLASTDYFNRVQLAERVMRYFGHPSVKLVPVSTAELQQPAARPLLGGMSAAKFNGEFPNFQWSNVDDYLKTIQHNK